MPVAKYWDGAEWVEESYIGTPSGATAAVADLWGELPTLAYCAHRCDSNMFPEEALESAQASVGLGITDCLELDVNVTRDGALVCHHNATTSATMTTTVDVADQTVATWRNLRFKDSGQKPKAWWGTPIAPVLLTDMLREFGDKVLLSIEPKSQAAGDLLPGVLGKWIRRKSNVMIPTFVDAYGVPAKNAGYNVVARDGAGTNVQSLVNAGYTHLNVDVDLLTQAYVTDLHNHGLTVWAWTINRHKDRDRAIGYGVDGIITDDTGYMSEAKRLTSDPYDTQSKYHGHLYNGNRNGGDSAGTFVTPDEWGLDNNIGVAGVESGFLAGWACPMKGNKTASSYTVNFSARMVTAFATTSNFTVAIASTDEGWAGGVDGNPAFRGYAAFVRNNGDLQIRKYPGDGTEVTLATVAGTALDALVKQYTLTVTASSISLTRGAQTVTTSDATLGRGGYLNLGAAGTSTRWSNITIS